jgi:cytochrome b561
MKIRNTQTNYGLVPSLLHWIVAIIIIGLLVFGLYMVRLPISLEKLKFYGYHKEFGILVLMLVILRVIWRMTDITPLLPHYMPKSQKVAARSVHYLFYVFMFAMPITGWIITSAAGLPVSFFGWFVLPNLVHANGNTQMLFTTIHKWLGWALIGIIGLHIAGTLHHYVFHKDNLIRRVWP